MSSKQSPKVAIITVNYNQLQYTIDCVRSVLDSDYGNFELYLIDNGSEREIVDALESNFKDESKVCFVDVKENLGYVGGVNHGLQLAAMSSPDFFLIMNNDTLIDEVGISQLVKAAEKHERKAIVSGKVFNYDERDTLQYIGQRVDPENGLNQTSIVVGRREKDVGQYDQEMEMGMLDDIFWLMPSELYQEIGGYSKYFFLYGEQNDYAFRAIKSGYKLIYTPEAKLWHKGGASTCDGDKTSPKIEYWMTMATLKLAVLHLPENKSKSFVYQWPLKKLLKYAYFVLIRRRNFAHLKAVVLAIRDFSFWNKVRYSDNGYNPFNTK